MCYQNISKEVSSRLPYGRGWFLYRTDLGNKKNWCEIIKKTLKVCGNLYLEKFLKSTTACKFEAPKQIWRGKSSKQSLSLRRKERV